MPRSLSALMAIAVLCTTSTALGAPPALPDDPGYPLIEAFRCADDAAARAAWVSMYESAPVSAVKAGPRCALRLPCNLAGSTTERATWDWRVNLDLANSKGFQFRFYCADSTPVAHFNIYFRSGSGWYVAQFAARIPDGWNLVRIGKAGAWTELKPGGWGKVDLVRISAWRGKHADTECYIADLGLWEGDATVAIPRQKSAVLSEHAETKSIQKFTDLAAGILDDFGFLRSPFSDMNLTPERLAKTKTSILSELPALPEEPGYPLIEAFSYADDASARAVWKPRNESSPVEVVKVRPRNALLLPCNLAGTDMERASWDWHANLDLANCKGLQFRFYCADSTPVSHFAVHFRSGSGWYGAQFAAPVPDAWSLIRIGKAGTSMEGRPVGWGKVDLVRISAWRGKDVDTECCIADFGLWESDAAIAILRQESAALNEHVEMKSIQQFAELTADILDDFGLPCSLLSDMDLTPERLARTKVLVLPYCPGLGGHAASVLGEFVKNGGKIVSFYSLPAELLPALGFGLGPLTKQVKDGDFASIRAVDGGLKGLPNIVPQASSEVAEVLPAEARGRVAARWYNGEEQDTGHAAIVVSDVCAHMTSPLLAKDRTTSGLILLAMLGHFLPEYWEMAASYSLDHAGVVADHLDFAEAEEALRKTAGQTNAPASEELDRAKQAHQKGVELARAGQYADAVAAAREARTSILNAYCSLQQPLAGEHRAFWCHSAFGIDGMTWDEAIKNLADKGFTAILPNMLWGGTAFYKSDVLPVSPEVAKRGDQIEQCVAACKKYGIQCHVWKVNWNMGWHAPRDFMERMKKEGRTQVMFDGAEEGRWLCPSHPANQQLEIDSMVEVATKYDVDGLHFDYIRYPNENGCFCAGCKKRFEEAIGKKIENWPADVRAHPDLQQRWFDFRRQQITKVVRAVSERTRKAKPAIKLSAAVFGNWPHDRDAVGQDWKMWCDEGYLDFACPMDYTPSNAQFKSMVAQQLEWAGKVPCYPGIGMSCWPDATDIVKLIEQIGITRKLGTGGFTIFNYDVSAAANMVPLCGKGITRRE